MKKVPKNRRRRRSAWEVEGGEGTLVRRREHANRLETAGSFDGMIRFESRHTARAPKWRIRVAVEVLDEGACGRGALGFLPRFSTLFTANRIRGASRSRGHPRPPRREPDGGGSEDGRVGLIRCGGFWVRRHHGKDGSGAGGRRFRRSSVLSGSETGGAAAIARPVSARKDAGVAPPARRGGASSARRAGPRLRRTGRRTRAPERARRVTAAPPTAPPRAGAVRTGADHSLSGMGYTRGGVSTSPRGSPRARARPRGGERCTWHRGARAGADEDGRKRGRAARAS